MQNIQRKLKNCYIRRLSGSEPDYKTFDEFYDRYIKQHPKVVPLRSSRKEQSSAWGLVIAAAILGMIAQVIASFVQYLMWASQ